MATTSDAVDLAPEKDLSFTLYPNPVTGRLLRLNGLPASQDVATIQIIGVDGRRICELESSSATIQIPDRLAPGQYFLSFSMGNGARHARRITVTK